MAKDWTDAEYEVVSETHQKRAWDPYWGLSPIGRAIAGAITSALLVGLGYAIWTPVSWLVDKLFALAGG